MHKDLLRGVFAPVTTPFKKDGALDLEGLAKNMEQYKESRLNGYLAIGSNGENKSMTEEEKLQVLATIIAGKAPEQIVMVGCIAESTIETISFAKKAAALGADYLTLLSPSYFKKQMTDDALYKYFSDIADAVDKPCLVYCAPQFTGGIVLSPSLVKRLASHKNIVGMKDSSTGNIDSYLMAVPEDFAVMAGSANFFISSLTNGAVGGVISLANAFPEITCQLYDLYVAKEYEKCFALNRKILLLNKAVSGKGGVASVKAAMDLAGLVGGDPRLPVLPMESADIEAMATVLKEYGLI